MARGQVEVKTPAPKPRAKLSEQDAMRLAVETMTSLSAVKRWARGDKVQQTTNARLTAAANRLGIKGATT